MDQSAYRQLIETALKADARLEPCLRKVVAACTASVPGQITLGSANDIDHFELARLFHPRAVKERYGKIVLLPAKMIEAGIDFPVWLKAAAELVPTAPAVNRDSAPETLLGKLAMLYPGFPTAMSMLNAKNSAVKKKITESGFDAALAHYRLALDAAARLRQAAAVVSPAEFGAKLTGNSKSFKPGSALWNLTAAILAEELDAPVDTVMASCGLLENSTASTVTVYGPFLCCRNDGALDWVNRLRQHGEAAILHAGNLAPLSRIEIAGQATPEVITCENESPFNLMLKTPGLSPLIYTAGMPNSAVRRFLSLLPERTVIRHWGDTDPEGLAIAAMLNRIRPVTLFRCGRDEVEKFTRSLRPLDERKRRRGETLLADPDFPFRDELRFTLEHGWLEQEAWTPF